MRLFIRSALIALVSIEVGQRIVGGIDFGSNFQQSLSLLVVAIALLNIFMIPIFRILSLPHFGWGFIFLNFVLTMIVLYVLTIFIPSITITEASLPELRFFGFVIPSRELSIFESAASSALTISIVYHFIEWLFDKR